MRARALLHISCSLLVTCYDGAVTLGYLLACNLLPVTATLGNGTTEHEVRFHIPVHGERFSGGGKKQKHPYRRDFFTFFALLIRFEKSVANCSRKHFSTIRQGANIYRCFDLARRGAP